MRHSAAALGLAVVGLVCFAQSALAAGVYKWTDENGVAHYSDAPPEGKQYDKINVRGKVEIEGAAEEAPAPAPVATAAPAKPTNQSNCELARKNVATFKSDQGVLMDRDGDGTPEPLDDAARAAELARYEELVKLFCK